MGPQKVGYVFIINLLPMKKFYYKFPVFLLICAFALGLALPAKAFYLEVPRYFIEAIQASRQQVLGESTSTPLQSEEMLPSNQGETCNVDGKELPGPCSNYNQGPSGQGNEGFGPGGEGQYSPGPNFQEEMQKQQQARQLQDIKRGGRQQERDLKQFEAIMQSMEKKGMPVSQDIKDKVTRAKQILEKINAANSMEEMAATTYNAETGENQLEELQEIMQSLEETRREVFEGAQRLQDIKRNVKGAEAGIKMFEKQIAKLAKQKITVPQEIQENISKAKAIIDMIKNAKLWSEVGGDEGMQSFGEVIQSLDENRQQLEMLARWPQTLKEMNGQLTKLKNELKRSKSIVLRLAKKDVDLSGVYATFEAAVERLKSVRDGAVAKIAAGNAEEAFDLVENDFFGQTDDVWQNSKVIQTMNNLGRFSSEFKKGIAMAQKQVKNLKKQGKDVSELEGLLEQSKAKGGEVLAMMKKGGDIDEETIMGMLEELEDLRQLFEIKMSEITGQDEEMPWEQGPQQFKRIETNINFDQFKKKE